MKSMKTSKMNNSVCMLSTGHGPLDDRIYYKEVHSLRKKYSSIYMIMPDGKDDFPQDNEQIKFIPLRKVNSLLSRFLIIPQALIKLLKLKPTVCHFHDFELIFTLPFIRLFSSIKIIYDIHEVYPEMAYDSQKIPKLLRPLMEKLVDISERFFARFAHYLITADENIAERFKSPGYRVEIVYNYPRLQLFAPKEDQILQLKQKYYGKIPIIYSGTMSINKGIYQMVRAMVLIKKYHDNILLILAGPMDEQMRAKVKQIMRELQLENNVQILGKVPHHEIVNYISIAKVGLIAYLPIPKYHKNIPIKQFEYMSCGIPVLGANLPPIASYIQKANCGRTFDSTKEEELAKGVRMILDDRNGWKRTSESGKKAVLAWWNWDKMEPKLFSVYDQLLN
ncbi:MAG: glycosyltransferase [Candidatus Lokiarchaeota archaeon]|nr:glycosyltransferase [Candidatus Lokiarchaeota archaeon]